MKLKQYLNRKGISVKAFSILSGISLASLYLYINRGTVPRLEIANRIVELTENEVTLEDLGYENIYKKVSAKKSQRRHPKIGPESQGDGSGD